MTFDNILSWALKARPGEELIYHEGKQLSTFQNKHDYSDAVWGARYCYNGGFVDFKQKRDGSQFFYIMVKRKSISPPQTAYTKDGQRIDRFSIPYRYYRNSSFAGDIDGKWSGEYGEAA